MSQVNQPTPGWIFRLGILGCSLVATGYWVKYVNTVTKPVQDHVVLEPRRREALPPNCHFTPSGTYLCHGTPEGGLVVSPWEPPTVPINETPDENLRTVLRTDCDPSTPEPPSILCEDD